MPKLTWDASGTRRYETGVDQGVLYIPTAGVYDSGVAWNGLTTVTESPAGAESNPQYADNIQYLNLLSAETLGGTIEAFTYPDEFMQCDGSYAPSVGVNVTMQSRTPFGLSYRTKIGTDESADAGYKYHLLYGALAAPSEKAYATVNDSPEALSLSWAFTTTPVPVTGQKPTALITIDSTKVTAAQLTALTDALYGSATDDPRLPLPDEIISMFGAASVQAPAAQTEATSSPTQAAAAPVAQTEETD